MIKVLSSKNVETPIAMQLIVSDPLLLVSLEQHLVKENCSSNEAARIIVFFCATRRIIDNDRVVHIILTGLTSKHRQVQQVAILAGAWMIHQVLDTGGNIDAHLVQLLAKKIRDSASRIQFDDPNSEEIVWSAIEKAE